ncbi:MAG: sulfotransferase domain-containing protein [Gammaproteobacteria bacterium]
MYDILIAGYPKSGNTWLTRLTAELADCPARGFWGQKSHIDGSEEGENRQSDFRCFKAHHTYAKMLDHVTERPIKVIYVVRDPRDVIISSAHFFNFRDFFANEFNWREQTRPPLAKVSHINDGLAALHFPRTGIFDVLHTQELLPRDFYRIFMAPTLNSLTYKISLIMTGVLFGNPSLHSWTNVSWQEHIQSYRNTDCLFIQYENMLQDAPKECRKICTYLGIERTDAQIQQAVDNQSFEKKKAFFESQGEWNKSAFLRQGRHGQWRGILKPSQTRLIRRVLRKEMAALNYT